MGRWRITLKKAFLYSKGMLNFKDQKLYSAFLSLTKKILDNLNNRLDEQTKGLLNSLDMPGLYKIYRKYFENNSKEFETFERILLNEPKYSKNFSENIGIKGLPGMYGKSIEQVLESIFIDYLKENGLTYNEKTINEIYDDLEKFFIEDKIRITVKVPINGLRTENSELNFNNELKIVRLSGQRKVHTHIGTETIKHALAFHDLVYQFYADKISQSQTESTKVTDLRTKTTSMIEQFLIALRLCHKGRVGFGDCNMNYSIMGGGVSWYTVGWGLTRDWNSWLSNEYSLIQKDIPQITEILAELRKIDFTTKSNRFLGIAIDRFMFSYEKFLPEDRILDLIISLESMFQDSIDELKFKLSVRIASFLGKSPQEKNLIYHTMLEAYKIRSKTSHGQNVDKITIDGKEMTLEELADKVEEYTRLSIKEFLKRTNNSEKRNDILTKLTDELFLN